MTEYPTQQVLLLSTNKSKAHFCDVPSPKTGVQPNENTIRPLKSNLFPRKQSMLQRTGVHHLSQRADGGWYVLEREVRT